AWQVYRPGRSGTTTSVASGVASGGVPAAQPSCCAQAAQPYPPNNTQVRLTALTYDLSRGWRLLASFSQNAVRERLALPLAWSAGAGRRLFADTS
ncbi:MAG: hypothetical protein ACRYG8_16040, partial [Janthinobacterium lividum]